MQHHTMDICKTLVPTLERILLRLELLTSLKNNVNLVRFIERLIKSE